MTKTPLLLVPGVLCSPRLFAAQVAALEGEAEIVVPDWRRAPLSIWDSWETAARWVVDQMPAEKFALAGLSLGGMLAVEIMQFAADRQPPRYAARPHRITWGAALGTQVHGREDRAAGERQLEGRRPRPRLPGRGRGGRQGPSRGPRRLLAEVQRILALDRLGELADVQGLDDHRRQPGLSKGPKHTLLVTSGRLHGDPVGLHGLEPPHERRAARGVFALGPEGAAAVREAGRGGGRPGWRGRSSGPWRLRRLSCCPLDAVSERDCKAARLSQGLADRRQSGVWRASRQGVYSGSCLSVAASHL